MGFCSDRFYKNQHGCYALKTKHGEHLAEMRKELDDLLVGSGIQLVTLSRPTAFGEYAPYRFVDTETEFRTIVAGMKV